MEARSRISRTGTFVVHPLVRRSPIRLIAAQPMYEGVGVALPRRASTEASASPVCKFNGSKGRGRVRPVGARHSG